MLIAGLLPYDNIILCGDFNFNIDHNVFINFAQETTYAIFDNVISDQRTICVELSLQMLLLTHVIIKGGLIISHPISSSAVLLFKNGKRLCSI